MNAVEKIISDCHKAEDEVVRLKMELMKISKLSIIDAHDAITMAHAALYPSKQQ